LLGLGPRRDLGRADHQNVTEVLAATVPYAQYQPGSQIDFVDESAQPFLGKGWYQPEQSFRWSRGNRSELHFRLVRPDLSKIKLSMFCIRRQRVTVELNQNRIAAFTCSQRSPHLRELPVPQGVATTSNTLVFILPDAISPSELMGKRDSRKLAIGVNWIELVCEGDPALEGNESDGHG
jgi:hypothetical protein